MKKPKTKPSQRQKRVARQLALCFCGGLPLLAWLPPKRERLKKCGLCRLAISCKESIPHVLAHYEPIADKVAQIESIVALMGTEVDLFQAHVANYMKACEQVMGWRPLTSHATEFFRRQVSPC